MSDDKANPGRPDSDGNRARAFLGTKGYRLGSDEVMSQRLVHLIDEAKRNELMIIYLEDLSRERESKGRRTCPVRVPRQRLRVRRGTAVLRISCRYGCAGTASLRATAAPRPSSNIANFRFGPRKSGRRVPLRLTRRALRGKWKRRTLGLTLIARDPLGGSWVTRHRVKLVRR